MISVIIPLYNKEGIIEKSLNSVLSQNYDDFEIVIVNDGSTDRSTDIVRSIKDSRICLVEQENGGPSKARNTGVKNAKGDWIVFLDADDELLQDALKVFDELTQQYKDCNFFCCGYNNKTANRIINAYTYKEKYVDNNFKSHFFKEFLPRTGAAIYKKDLIESCPFDEEIHRFEDLEALFRLYRVTKVFLCSQIVLNVNVEYASASNGRRDIKEDFLGHIDFKGKSFWEKMCLYQLFLGERPHYPEQCRKLYPSLYKRFDLYFIYQFLSRTKRLWA